MAHYRLCLVGFGNVGKAFARLLLEKKTELQGKYNLTVSVTGIITGSHGAAINPDGLDLLDALTLVDDDQRLDELSTVEPPSNALDFIAACPADFMFETTPVNPQTGQPAIDHIRKALGMEMHVVTANKGPVVHGFKQLTALAKEQGKRFLFESAVMDGAPIFALFRQPLVGANLLGFHGILNSCTNLLLELMEKGQSLEDAIEYGRSIGITETNPSNDIDGWDASIKVAALVTVLMGIPLKPQDVDRTGIRSVTPAMITDALAAGERWKLVCTAELVGDRQVIASVQPQRIGPESAFYAINGTSSYCEFKLDVLPGLGILESNPGPETTAYGLLADMLNILEVV